MILSIGNHYPQFTDIYIGNWPLTGVSADRTAINLIDMDGRDENGQPIIEQVICRKEIGWRYWFYEVYYISSIMLTLCWNCTGGQGDAAILTMLNLGYTNHYDDSSQRTYTMQNQSMSDGNYMNRLPGFHFKKWNALYL